ncbi:hypothetical protein LSCM1_03704 [Leishmania martiniquensis]|uniref:Uncharacterized protein n=1 Tax=Leishmania martiniquensis TaxID=1580590 RepID=A0A836GUW4_9TRYP|nr:hypothetical protein LSCM1_03704 [Leishmania martiniquensis]
MSSYDRSVAIASSAVYGAALCFGMVIFLSMRDPPFCRHPSLSVTVFSVFLFSFAPSILFIGATIPWLCVAYGSRQATLAFAIAPGCIFVLLAALWLAVYDLHKRASYFAAPPHNAWWGSNGENLGAASGGSAARLYQYAATDRDMVDGVELASFANDALPRANGAWIGSFSSPGFEDANAAPARASQWQYHNAGHEPGITSGTGGRAAGYAHSAGWYRGLPALSDHAAGRLQPSSLAQERGLGMQYVA